VLLEAAVVTGKFHEIVGIAEYWHQVSIVS